MFGIIHVCIELPGVAQLSGWTVIPVSIAKHPAFWVVYNCKSWVITKCSAIIQMNKSKVWTLQSMYIQWNFTLYWCLRGLGNWGSPCQLQSELTIHHAKQQISASQWTANKLTQSGHISWSRSFGYLEDNINVHFSYKKQSDEEVHDTLDHMKGNDLSMCVSYPCCQKHSCTIINIVCKYPCMGICTKKYKISQFCVPDPYLNNMCR